MAGSFTQYAGLPSPLSLLVRVLAVSVLVIAVAHWARRPLATMLVQPLRSVVGLLDRDFKIMSVDIASDGSNDSLRIRADLAHAVDVGLVEIQPFGAGGRSRGWYQADLYLEGLFSNCILLFVIVFSWPVRRNLEYMCRVALIVPLVALLLFIDLPFTVLGELWRPLHTHYQSDVFWPLLAWSKFMMGGGGYAIAASLGLLTIWVSGRWDAASVTVRGE